MPAFYAWMVTFFQDTPLPGWPVTLFATAIPYVGLGRWRLLISRLDTKSALVAAAVLGMLLLAAAKQEQ